MANYYATARTNYFKVKDIGKFGDFCDSIGVQMIKRTMAEDEEYVGFLCSLDDCGSLPCGMYDEEQDDHVEIDLPQELAKHLAEGEVAVMVEAGYEKFRYVTGFAQAVNWKGEEAFVSIEDIYKKAQEELGGENVSKAEF